MNRAPSFIGSPSTTASGSRGQYNNHFQELEDEDMEFEDDNDPPPSTRGVTPPREPETSHGYTSVRTPPGPPLHQDIVSPGAQQGIIALKPANPFACLPPKKHRANTEVFSAFTGQSKGNNPTHIKLCEAGLAMAKRVFHPPKAERWPTAEGNVFMMNYLTLVPSQKIDLESDLYQETFLKEHEKNPSYKQAFDFKTKMFGSLKSQRTFLV